MPEDLLEYLLEVCSQAERTGEWPVAAMTAIVSALEKTPGAGRVNQFRPISVLSFVYRVWASIRAKELLTFLSQCAPPHLFGFMPGRSSQAVWYALQHQLEVAHLTNEPLCGITTDLEKAFNFLPRLPVFAFAAHVGIPFPVIRAWTDHARTQIQDSWLCRSTHCQPHGLPRARPHVLRGHDAGLPWFSCTPPGVMSGCHRH